MIEDILETAPLFIPLGPVWGVDYHSKGPTLKGVSSIPVLGRTLKGGCCTPALQRILSDVSCIPVLGRMCPITAPLKRCIPWIVLQVLLVPHGVEYTL